MEICLRKCESKPHSGYGRPELRFWQRVNKDGGIHPTHGQCWEWTGGFFVDGYGQISIKNRPERASRFSWMLHNGAIPSGQHILHKCDNRKCVNPGHLFLGTSADNVRDMVSKGRQPRGDTHGSKTKPECVLRGVKHGRAKLTEDQVKEIRQSYKYGSSSMGSGGLALKYGVSQHLIMCIIKRKVWKHV